jgi:hypothetical protein
MPWRECQRLPVQITTTEVNMEMPLAENRWSLPVKSQENGSAIAADSWQVTGCEWICSLNLKL